MRDMLGNELKVGDLVLIQLDRPVMFGEITEITEGGLVSVADANPRPGTMKMLCKHAVLFDPRANCGAVVALRNDENRIKIGEGVKVSEALPN